VSLGLKMNARDLLVEVMQHNLPPIAESVPFSEIAGWDSLKMVNMVIRLEQLLQRELAEDELESLNTVGDLAVLLSAS